MTYKEALEASQTGKKVRRNSLQSAFGKIVQPDSASAEFVTDEFKVSLTLSDVLAEDWEIESGPRTFYIGVKKLTNYASGRETLQYIAIESTTPPTGPTDTNQPWIKVVEVKE